MLKMAAAGNHSEQDGECKCLKCTEMGLSAEGSWLLAHKDQPLGFQSAVNNVLGKSSIKVSGRNYCLQSKKLAPIHREKIDSAVRKFQRCPLNLRNAAFRAKIGKNNICALLDECSFQYPNEAPYLLELGDRGEQQMQCEPPTTNNVAFDMPQEAPCIDANTFLESVGSGETDWAFDLQTGLKDCLDFGAGEENRGILHWESHPALCQMRDDCGKDHQIQIERIERATALETLHGRMLNDEISAAQARERFLMRELQDSNCRIARLMDELGRLRARSCRNHVL